MSVVTRREFVQCAAATVAASALGVPGEAAKKRRLPNVIYAFSDEHRYQSMSFSEMPELHTPNMARLASQGITFTHCVSNYPVCSPYRAMLMTGRWPYHQRMLDDTPGMIDNNYPLSPEQMTLGKAFKQAGYVTGYIGKWHLGGTRAEPFGFDLSLIWTNTNRHWNKSKYHPKDGPPVQPQGYNATLMTDQALTFIEQHRKHPFFLMLSWNPPHSNFTDSPEDMKALYPRGRLEYRPNVDLRDGDVPLGGASWRTYRGYHAHVSAIDRELGRLLSALDRLHLADDTILIYSSDHGSMLGSHHVGGKRQPYEESIRTPFILRYPGVVPAGQTSDLLLGTIDKFPSLCALAGIPVPPTCDGHDFSAAFRGQPVTPPTSQFLMHISKKHASGGERHPAPIFRGVTTGRYTYACYPDRPWCLFDNQEDPYQLHNLIEDPGKRTLCTELREELSRWLAKADDPFTLPG